MEVVIISISIGRGLFIGIFLKTLDFPSQTLIFKPILDISEGISNLFLLEKIWRKDV